ncbi:MAG TPA: BlaI/MecI/CopY family transcriptional regulator [Steroidobacteraceae bacterium]|nr:BlaI/MecI/CopY family transcriptional regulator [Steroidobacteraceae bacterium]
MEIVLADREAELMEVLWDHGPSTVAEVRDRVPDDLAYTTVLSMLRTLEAKGYVTHDAEGKAHRYSAVIERDAARRSALRAMSEKFFKGSTATLLTHFVAQERLSAADVQRLRKLLAQRAKKGRS